MQKFVMQELLRAEFWNFRRGSGTLLDRARQPPASPHGARQPQASPTVHSVLALSLGDNAWRYHSYTALRGTRYSRRQGYLRLGT